MTGHHTSSHLTANRYVCTRQSPIQLYNIRTDRQTDTSTRGQPLRPSVPTLNYTEWVNASMHQVRGVKIVGVV